MVSAYLNRPLRSQQQARRQIAKRLYKAVVDGRVPLIHAARRLGVTAGELKALYACLGLRLPPDMPSCHVS